MGSKEADVLDIHKFERLLQHCGLDLEEETLRELERRKLLVPLGGQNGESSSYRALHLFVAARYLDLVARAKHPWQLGAPVILEPVKELASQVNQVLRGEGEKENLLREVERYLAGINPFGPLGQFLDLLQDRVVKEMRNQGRLYVELHRVALDFVNGEGKVVEKEDTPLTRPMFGVDGPGRMGEDLRSTQVIDEAFPRREETGRAIDNVVAAASGESRFAENPLLEDEIDTQILNIDELNQEEEEEEREESFERLQEDLRSTQVLEASAFQEPQESPQGGRGLREESSEPIVLLKESVEEDVELEEEHHGEEEHQEEEEELLLLDEDLLILDDEIEESSKPVKESNTAARIQELNRLRQVYLTEQRWEELVDLYEEGLELFVDPAELQTVYLVLATLYETKLGNVQRGVECFAKAFEVKGGEGRKKAMKSLERLMASHPEEALGKLTRLLEEGEIEKSPEETRWLKQKRVKGLLLTRGEEVAEEILLDAVLEEGDFFFDSSGLDLVQAFSARREGAGEALFAKLGDCGLSEEILRGIQDVTGR